MKKVFAVLFVIMFMAGCVEVTMPSSYSNSDATSGSEAGSSVYLIQPAQQQQPANTNTNQPAYSQVTQPTYGKPAQQEEVTHGRNGYEGQSSPVYLDLCIGHYNKTSEWKWNNCYDEIRKSGRLNELKDSPAPVDSNGLKNDPITGDDTKTSKTP